MRMMNIIFLIVNKLYRINFKLSTTAVFLNAIIGAIPDLRILIIPTAPLQDAHQVDQHLGDVHRLSH